MFLLYVDVLVVLITCFFYNIAKDPVIKTYLKNGVTIFIIVIVFAYLTAIGYLLIYIVTGIKLWI